MADWRRRLARWLDPQPAPAQPVPASYPPPHQSAPVSGGGGAAMWQLVCEQIALRVLAASYQMASQVEEAEADEQDPRRLEQLYRIDHAVTRVRRHAEILQVLSGRAVEDARRQITTLLDIARAATSAVEYYQRVHLGHLAELAVVEFAADDLIRILTEVLDNATRFSPPASTVVVSAHLTETGSILIRVEDTGVGVPQDQLATLNAMLSGGRLPVLGATGEPQFGLQVVARLAAAHRMGVSLTARATGGTTATILVPAPLICEIPPPPAPARSRRPGSHRAPAQAPVLLPPPGDDPTDGLDVLPSGLPRRVTASLRGALPAEPVAPRPTFADSGFREPAFSEPAFSEPVVGEPVFGKPVFGEPVGVGPAGAGPQLDPPTLAAGLPVLRTPWHEEVAGFAAGFEAGHDPFPVEVGAPAAAGPVNGNRESLPQLAFPLPGRPADSALPSRPAGGALPPRPDDGPLPSRPVGDALPPRPAGGALPSRPVGATVPPAEALAPVPAPTPVPGAVDGLAVVEELPPGEVPPTADPAASGAPDSRPESETFEEEPR